MGRIAKAQGRRTAPKKTNTRTEPSSLRCCKKRNMVQMYSYKVKHIVLPHRADDGNDDDLEGIADKAMRVGWLSHRIAL